MTKSVAFLVRFSLKYYIVLDGVSCVSSFLQSVMENSDRGALSSPSVAFTTPIKTLGTPTQPGSTPRISTMRPLATAYKASTSDYQVFRGKWRAGGRGLMFVQLKVSRGD